VVSQTKERTQFEGVSNRVLRRIFEMREREWWVAGEDCIMRSFINFKLQQILLGW
jgi:hypothetical protein